MMTIQPKEVLSDGEMWNLNGGKWRSDSMAFNIDNGDYIVSFKPIAGWNTPDSQKVRLSSNTLLITAEYQPPNLKNLIETLQVLCEIQHPDNQEYLDLNSDGKINLSDALMIVMKLSGKSNSIIKYHSADYNPKDLKFNLSELLRVAQLYNNNGNTCGNSGIEDGYSVDLNGHTTECDYHSSDFAHKGKQPDWIIDSCELSRMKQLHNAGCYKMSDTEEDGFMPVVCDQKPVSKNQETEILNASQLVEQIDNKTLEIKNTIEYTGAIYSFMMKVQIPLECYFLQYSGQYSPDFYKYNEAEKTLEFIWIKPPPQSFEFSYYLSGKKNNSGIIKSEIQYRRLGRLLIELVKSIISN